MFVLCALRSRLLFSFSEAFKQNYSKLYYYIVLDTVIDLFDL